MRLFVLGTCFGALATVGAFVAWAHFQFQPAAEPDLVELMSQTDEISVFLALVVASGYDELLSGDQDFTVFAPTNEAFVRLSMEPPAFVPPEQFAKLMVENHVAQGAFSSDDFGRGVPTIQGPNHQMAEILQTLNGGGLRIRKYGEGDMQIGPDAITTEIRAANGILYIVDGAQGELQPPTWTPLNQAEVAPSQ